MKYEIERTSQFKKDYKLAVKRGLDINRLKAVIQKLADGEPLPPANRDPPFIPSAGGCGR